MESNLALGLGNCAHTDRDLLNSTKRAFEILRHDWIGFGKYHLTTIADHGQYCGRDSSIIRPDIENISPGRMTLGRTFLIFRFPPELPLK